MICAYWRLLFTRFWAALAILQGKLSIEVLNQIKLLVFSMKKHIFAVKFK